MSGQAEANYERAVLKPGDPGGEALLKRYENVEFNDSSEIHDWANGHLDLTLVITNGTSNQRSAAGVYALSLLDPPRKYWREVTYQDNLDTLKELGDMAKRLPNDLAVVKEFHDYEHLFYENWEACPILFMDGIGDSGFWPDRSIKLIRMLENRQLEGLTTVVAIGQQAFDRVPTWERFSDPLGPNYVVDLGTW